ncbi:MAG: 5-oxoprolinase subunit PxpB [Lysobacter sp.]|nr:5-oxoprolinase subunit PxpB [Lysobacter sp.]
MTPRFEALAGDAWLIHLGTTADTATNAHVHAIVARIRATAPSWLRDLVPAYTSLGVFFDGSIDADSARDWLRAQCLADIETTTAPPSRTVEIPVCYGGAHGEDLEAAATELGIAPAELIARHGEATYTVAMIGFAPGFPYLGGLDPTLALPRLATPRTHVPAGSVAIGGAQTGIYPRESPGGWRLLGRTPLRLFDARRDPPSLLAPGDRVRFVAIDADTFARSEREA